jgi:hypothetical protein
VALLVAQASETGCPVCTVEGVALKFETLAAGAIAVTLMATVLGVPVPPGPVQVKV